MHEEKAAILFNPAAGKGRASKLKGRLEKCLREFEIPHELYITRSAENLRELARELSLNYKTIVGAGGDSTFQIIADEIRKAGGDAAMGLIGLGSSNDIAKEFHVDSLERACLAIKKRQTKRIDLGTIRHEKTSLPCFVGQANIGLGVCVNRYVEELTVRRPRLAKVQAAAGALGIISALRARKIPLSLRIESAEGKVEGDLALALFSNIRYWATGRRVVPAAQPDDAKLDACLIQADTFCRLLSLARKAKTGKHVNHQGVKLLQSASFSVSSDKPFAIQADGEIIGGWQNPALFQAVEIGVIPKALDIIVGAVSQI